MTNKDLRPQTVKKPSTVEVKVAAPWVIIMLMVVAVASFVYGWTERSGQIVTRDEIRAEVLTGLKTHTSKK